MTRTDSELIHREGPDGTLRPASKWTDLHYAKHGEWERQLDLATLVRSEKRNRRIRDEVGTALQRRIYYWLGRQRPKLEDSDVTSQPEQLDLEQPEAKTQTISVPVSPNQEGQIFPIPPSDSLDEAKPATPEEWIIQAKKKAGTWRSFLGRINRNNHVTTLSTLKRMVKGNTVKLEMREELAPFLGCRPEDLAWRTPSAKTPRKRGSRKSRAKNSPKMSRS